MPAGASETGTATGHKDLLDRVRKFLTGFGYGDNVQENGGGSPGDNVGDGSLGSISGTLTTVDETIQATYNGTNWDVTGSVTGSMGTATTGVQFSHANIVFTISGGSPSFVTGDSFTFDAHQGLMAAAGVAWSQNKWDTSGEYELQLQAPGISGSDEIYVGWKTYEGTDALGNYFNWYCQGYTGYNAGLTFTTQPGAIAKSQDVSLALWDSSTPYWITANGQAVVIIAKVSTTYQMAYSGFFNPYGTPSQYPYPLAIGGTNIELNSEYRWSSTYNSAFTDPFRYSSFSSDVISTLMIRNPSGSWVGVGNQYGTAKTDYTPSANTQYFTLPYKESNYDIQIEGQGNQYRMNPIALCRYLTDVYGELDLVYQITGNNTASEDTVTDSVSPTNNYTVFQNCDKSNIRNYCCVEML